MISTDELKMILAEYVQPSQYIRHWLNREMEYTDGVECFVKEAGAEWFLDEVAVDIRPLLVWRLLVSLVVAEDKQCEVVVQNMDERVVYRRCEKFVACPVGTWRFYLARDEGSVFCLPSEY